MENKMTAEEANKNRVLITEDIRKYELAKANAEIQIAKFDAMIRECELALADIDRLVAGVEYPEPPKTSVAETGEDSPKAVMGKPVGGTEAK